MHDAAVMGLGTCLLGAGAASCLLGGPATAPQHPPQAGRVAPAAVVEVNLAGKAGSAAAVVVLAGSILEVRITGRAGAAATWAFAYDGTVLAQGLVALGRPGAGLVRLSAPDVRHRAVCILAVKAAKVVTRRRIIVYPTSPLAHARRRAADLEIAVLDETGRTQRALASQGICCESIDGQIARDFTRPGTVILGGFRGAKELSRACRNFERRVEAGMSAVVLNPPANWAGWGVRAVRRDKPATGGVRFARSMGRLVRAADVGSGPWELTIETDGNSTPLVWVPALRSGRAGGKALADPCLLVAARGAGKGQVIVSTLPQTRNADTDAVGRGVLSEIILWLADPERLGRPPRQGD